MAEVDFDDQEEEIVQEGPLFKKFSEIENTYREKAIELIVLGGFNKLEWVALEKVHGSNFCFITDGNTINCAKRTSLISNDPNEKQFNNHLSLVQKYEKSILQAFQMVKEQFNPDLTILRIFGEIFGGVYPHKEVPKSKTASAVQKGIYYCPEIDFYAFDLHDGTYLDYDKSLTVFQQCGFVHATPLAAGTFDEVLKYPNTFVTTIPKLYNLPEIPDNIAEGVVLKPIKNQYFGNGSRVILKNKTEKFVEKIGGNKRGIPKPPVQGPKLTPEAEKLMHELMSLVTSSRLDSVISKIGEVTMKDFGKLMQLYTKDVLHEFNKDWEQSFDLLPSEQQKLLTRALSNESTKIIKEYFVKEQQS